MRSHMKLVVAALAATAVVSLPCAADAARAKSVGVSGRILEAGTRNPIPGATAAATGAAGTFTAVANAKGEYTLALAAGKYLVRFDAEGWNTQYRAAEIQTTRLVLDAELMRTVPTQGAVSGTVSGPGGPVPGAVVASQGFEFVAVTDATGRYAAASAAGTLAVTASAAAFLPQARWVEVPVGGTAVADFTLAPEGAGVASLAATPTAFLEGTIPSIALDAVIDGAPLAVHWTQVAGPKVPLTALSAPIGTPGTASAVADVSGLHVAAEVTLAFELVVQDLSGAVSLREVTVDVAPYDLLPVLGPHVQIGGSSTATARIATASGDWALFNVGTALHATPIGMTKGPRSTLVLPGTIRDLEVVAGERTLVLAAVGAAGIAVVDATDPMALALVSVTPVGHYQDGIVFTDTGGTTTFDNVLSTASAPVVALATYGDQLFIADGGYGLHRTALANLVGPTGPVTDLADGTLVTEADTYTLHFAGEIAWGAPRSLVLSGGRLFAALGELGLGIFDPVTLAQVGGYNLYTDEARLEDHFGPMAVTAAVGRDPVTGDPFLDDVTGMPDYREVWWEVTQVMKGDVVAPTPWADFERNGKWFYLARDVDVAQQGARTIAYVAYSLGGLVAVDVTGAEAATPAQKLRGSFLGYFPAVAANGPYDTLSQPSSILPFEGAGMLKESGVVAVDVSGDEVFTSDHFAGLVIVDGAADPGLRWRGANAPYDNDTNGIPNDGVPDYENVTSYDMAPYDPLDNESLPIAFFQAPALLATSELAGHASDLLVLDPPVLDAAGAVDVLACSGAGGFVLVDVVDLSAPSMADRYAVPAWFPTTDEVGAAPDGSPTQAIAIGHTSGVAASGGFLYVADGPHGVSAWSLRDAAGFPADVIRLVANTVQDEYPVTVGGVTIYPPSHVSRAVFDPLAGVVWAACGRNGARRVDVAAVEAGAGAPGAPLLLPLARTDLFEHNSDFSVKALSYQDHAYDVALLGRYAWVADGSNGLTVYDASRDPSLEASGFFVANAGYGPTQPPLGTASGLEFWVDSATGRRYAIVAAGPYGVGVVDATDTADLRIVKVFEPIKLEDGDVGSADGQAIDVAVIGDLAYFTYDSFGVVVYALSDLVAPLPPGVDPTDLFSKQTSGTVLYDHRPVAVGRFKLQLVPGWEEVDGGAVRLDWKVQGGRLLLYVAFGEAGLLKLDFTDPAAPILLARADTAAEASDVVIADGRVYVADGSGGLVYFK